MTLVVHYPWKTLKKGQGFFVPCLDVETQRQDGLKAALKLRLLDARAIACIRGGRLGVWFFRAGSERS
jgi:hypothetical protein